MNKRVLNNLIVIICLVCSCTPRTDKTSTIRTETSDSTSLQDTLPRNETEPVIETMKPEQIHITKELLYDQYTLKDTYPYKDTTRHFQWEKIKEGLARVENLPHKSARWAILQNYKNRNGEAPLVKKYHRDAYKRIADTLGIERYQSIPLYLLTDTLTPERYAQDGELVRLFEDSGKFVKVAPVYVGDEWYVPQKYVKPINDTVIFNKVIFVDRTNQNIVTLDHIDKGNWVVRSMNPVTTGRHRPPYAQETPLGIFVLQEKKARMVYLKDGSQEKAGYAPYASRFTDGAYIHGVPVEMPRTAEIEYSWSLGTTPRSHMCVRNVTSHAKFVFGWAPVYSTLVFVIE